MDTDFLPKEITVVTLPDGQDDLEEWLTEKKGSKVIIRQPQRGEKAKEVRLSYQNAKLLLGEWLINRKNRRELVPKMVYQLQDDLQLTVVRLFHLFPNKNYSNLQYHLSLDKNSMNHLLNYFFETLNQ